MIETATGAWRLWADIPEGEAPEGGFATLWLLDGRSLFPLVSQTARRLAARPAATGVAPMVVIGLDHEPDNRDRRFADYTPGPPETADEEAMGRSFGGANGLLDLLTGQARAMATALAPLDPGRHVLLGHSMAGLFALHALSEQPGAFAVFGAFSPSVWWRPQALDERLAAMDDRDQRLFVAAGEREEPKPDVHDPRRSARRMVTLARAAAARVEDRLGAERVRLVVAPDEDHASALVTALPAFLRFIHAGRTAN